MIADRIALAVVDAAKKNKIEPAALLALVEVETGGKPFEEDGRTPAFLYERHIAWREAKKVSDTIWNAFRRAGLAIPAWDKATQYRDQRTSADRLSLIKRARAIQDETANRSASWGLGQIMGFHYRDLGFASAGEMVDAMTGSMAGQLDCLVRLLKSMHLIEPLNQEDWPHVARIFNGSGYAKNEYDVRLGDAFKRNQRRLQTLMPAGKPRAVPPEQLLSRAEIVQVQQQLRELNYAEVGDPEGTWGSRTVGGISAFQAHEGLPVTGHYDDATRAALNHAQERAPSIARQATTVDDLRQAGSGTIAAADSASWWAKLKMWVGGGAIAGGGAEKAGLFDHAQDAADKVSQVRSLWDSVSDFVQPLFAHWEIIALGGVLLGGGYVIFRAAEAVKLRRLADHQSGVHSGI